MNKENKKNEILIPMCHLTSCLTSCTICFDEMEEINDK